MSSAFEEQYYEEEALWVPGALGATDEERIRIASHRIPDDVRSVVDVGCGNGLFVNYLIDHHHSRFERIVGIDRSVAALRHVRAESMRASIDALPVADGSFDVATCMEVIEHLPLVTFDAALRELVRVSRRYILVTVPNDEDLSVAAVKCPSCGCVFNASYHMRSFDEARLRRLFEGTHDCMDVFPIAPEKALRRPVMRAIQRLRRVAGRPEPLLPARVMCPMCGYREQSKQHGPTLTGEALPGSLRQVVSRLVVVRRPRWMGALYARRS